MNFLPLQAAGNLTFLGMANLQQINIKQCKLAEWKTAVSFSFLQDTDTCKRIQQREGEKKSST